MNLRPILLVLEMQDSALYFVNGIMMFVSFLVVRLCFQYYILFVEMEYYMFYRYDEFWSLYPAHQHFWVVAGTCMYAVLYVLNIYWFSKITSGLFKTLGFDKAMELSSYEYEDYGGYQNQDADKK